MILSTANGLEKLFLQRPTPGNSHQPQLVASGVRPSLRPMSHSGHDYFFKDLANACTGGGIQPRSTRCGVQLFTWL